MLKTSIISLALAFSLYGNPVQNTVQIKSSSITSAEEAIKHRINSIYKILSETKPWHEDLTEDPEERESRLRTLANSIYIAALSAVNTGQFAGSQEELEILMATVCWWETRLARRIHEGKCKPDECDHGKAKGLPQVQLASGVPEELWANSEGLEFKNTLSSMHAATFVLSNSWKKCYKPFKEHRVFAAYGRGSCNATYQVKDRADWYRIRLQKYREYLAQTKV